MTRNIVGFNVVIVAFLFLFSLERKAEIYYGNLRPITRSLKGENVLVPKLKGMVTIAN